eukprot:gene14553-17199_t
MSKLILLLLFTITYTTLVNGDCLTDLKPFFDAAYNYKCINVTFVGLSTSGEVDSYKGNLHFNRYFDGLRQNNGIIGFDSADYQCSADGTVIQPFHVKGSYPLSEFVIYRNGSIQINGDFANSQMTCAGPQGLSFRFAERRYLVQLSINPIEAGCPKLNYGEPCGTVTPPPFYPVTFVSKIDNQWVNKGVTVYQLSITMTNNGDASLSNISFNGINNAIVDKNFWGFSIDDKGIYTLPDYIKKLDKGQSHTFGYVSTQTNPTFNIISAQRV